MTSVKDLDPYALTSTQFSHESRSKFSACWTMVGTIIVLLLSLIISFSAIRNIWIPRNQLPITIAKRTDSSKPLTTTPICLSFDSKQIPQHTVYNNQGQKIGRRMNEEQVYSFFPDLLADIGNRTHVCYDLEGIYFTPNIDYVQFNLFSNNATVHFKTYEISQILQQYITPIVNISQQYSYVKRQISVQLIEAYVYDSIFSSSETQVINSFKYQQTYAPTGIQAKIGRQQQNYFYLIVNKNDPIYEVTISRLTIGIIFGTILSWISIIFTIVAIIFIPYLEIKLSISIIKESFQLPKNISKKPNTLKIILAKFIKGIFKQQLFIIADQKLSKYKQVISLLYLKEALLKFYKDQLNYMQNKKKQTKYDQNFEEVISEIKQINIEQKTKKNKSSLKFSKDVPKMTIKTVITTLVKLFDIGTDPISINYSHYGYRSNKSFILTIMAIALLFSFFFYVGVFSIFTTTVRNNQYLQQQLTHVLNSTDLFFLLQPSAAEDSVSAFYLNQNYQQINQIILLKNDDCSLQRQFIQANDIQIKSNSIIYCFSFGTQLSTRNTTKYIGIKIQIKQLDLINGSIYLLKMNFQYKDEQVLEELQSNLFSSLLDYYTMKIKLIPVQLINQNIKSQYIGWSPTVIDPKNFNNPFNFFFQLNDYKIKIETKTITIFDIINEVWGLTTICFTFVLLKLNTFINKREVNTNINKQQSKISFPLFLSKIHLLSSGLKRNQLLSQTKFVKKKIIV